MSHSLDFENMRIVTATWLISMAGPSIKNGAALLRGGRILEVDKVGALNTRYPDIEIESFPGVFIPALINAHMHLELAHLPAKEPLPLNKSFTDWVEALLTKRFETPLAKDDIERSIAEQIDKQFDSGVVFIGDIGNTALSDSLDLRKNERPEIYHMLEFLGSSKEAVDDAYSRLSELRPEIKAVAHAPYSTRPELLKSIKQRCDRFGHVFSIHTAEIAAETEFISSGTGMFNDFLVKRGVRGNDFFEHGKTADSTIEYFSNLGLLDDKTLLVHCVDVSGSDLRLIKESGAHICICAGSNDFLHSGKPPIEEMIEAQLLPAIGTDSIASNLQVDMWEEMKRIKNDYPSIEAHDILGMATKAGACAYGQSINYGEIAEGKKSTFLHVYCDEFKNCINESDLLKMLVSNGRPKKIEWIQQTSVKSQSN